MLYRAQHCQLTDYVCARNKLPKTHLWHLWHHSAPMALTDKSRPVSHSQSDFHPPTPSWLHSSIGGMILAKSHCSMLKTFIRPGLPGHVRPQSQGCKWHHSDAGRKEHHFHWSKAAGICSIRFLWTPGESWGQNHHLRMGSLWFFGTFLPPSKYSNA